MLSKVAHKMSHWRPEDIKLANIEVLPAHRKWFARATINHLFWLPAHTGLICALILLLIAGHALGPIMSLGFLAVIGVLTAYEINCRHRVTVKNSTHNYRELAALKVAALVSGATWSIMLYNAIVVSGAAHMAGLEMLTCLLMAFAAIKYISTPHVGFIHILSVAIGAGLALMRLGGADAYISVALLAVITVHLYGVIYNLFYSFATRRLRTRVLKETNETVELLLRDFDEQGSDWLWEVDIDGKIQRPSARFNEAAGLKEDTLARKGLLDLFEANPERDALKNMIQSPQSFRRVVVTIMVDGEQHWWSLSGRAHINKTGQVVGLRGVATDVSASKRAEAKIAYMAHYDGLTDLPNRALFAETLKRALTHRKKNQKVSILYLDLDRFKMINDSMGHDVGDLVLQTAANRITSCIDTHDMVARLGGDEFAILLPRIKNRDDATNVAEAIIKAMAEPIVIDGQHINSGSSIGIAFAMDDETQAIELCKHADLALYDAKAHGGNISSIFKPTMYEAMLVKRAMEIDLGASMCQNELELYYQPLVNIESNEIVAYEALLRWNHPEHGQIQPTVFIPIAEETGLIVQIGEWVIRNALMEVRNWPEHVSVSVNVSPAQMRSPNLVPTIINALASSNVAPNRLELEITESILMNDSEANIALLHRLKSLGVRIALDDFGTGYSSLNYLRSFPFDKIKIDRCFIEDIADRADCQAIIHAVLSLASSLNMTTTAEGIEHVDQLARLKAEGCDQAQGFLFSRPMQAHKIEQRAITDQAAEPVTPMLIKNPKSKAA